MVLKELACFSILYKRSVNIESKSQAVNSSKKRTNEFVLTSMQHVFVCFLEEIEDSTKTFRNYLTFIPNLYISEFQFQYSHHKPTKSRILTLAWSGAIKLTRPYYG